MNVYRILLGLLSLTFILSCQDNTRHKEVDTLPADSLLVPECKVVYENSREMLALSTTDTITRVSARYLSNNQTPDLFVLKVAPGMVKNSRASFSIVAANGEVIYTQQFDAFYFIRDIFEPIPSNYNGSNIDYEAYAEAYRKSLTSQQFQAFFNKSIDSFFTSFNRLDTTTFNDIIAWGDDIKDKDFLSEVLADSAIILMDIPYFSSDEGGEILGYSRLQQKVVVLLEHD